MKIKVILEDQPFVFIRRQSPDVRKQLRAAIHAVERGDVFPIPLEKELEGFYKLVMDSYRFILKHETGTAGPLFKVVFAERRSVIHKLFKQILSLE